ncbi:filamentous hemagglutinin N-terminal domain-containing protein [Polynucleobacter paneuropaeus]|nr:filamentous hemagglutinin N-terminal domain-containing protein [Polynucleobacter paneuropaeus]
MSNTSRNLGISFLLSKKHAHRNDGHGVSVRKTVIASVFFSATLLTVPSAFAAPAANALPTNGQVVAGQANISQSGNVMNINQSTQRAVINWDSFNVGKNAMVNFNQPNANSSTLNRVNGASKSMIDGAVRSNGQVIFVNPNGVVFGKGAEVNTGGLVATTMNIKDSDYMSGKMIFSGGESGKVINKGTITANGVNGYIALMAPEVKNQGVLIANISNSNTIALVSGTKVTLSFDGSQLTNITVDASAINSLISNKHAITTNGGQIIIAANAASNLKSSVINNTGTISADTVSTVGGKVFLTAGTVNQSGTMSANSAEADGGNVTISGNQVNLNTASKTSATGATAGGQILIGKTTQNAAQSQVNASNVTVSQGALVDASATQNGNGGSIQVWSTISTSVAGLFKANGGAIAGNGGNIDTSSAGTVIYGKGLVVDTTAPKGKTGNWLTDPLSIIIDSTAATILSNALMTTNVTLDATASSCAGIGNCTTSSVSLIQFLAGTSVYSTADTALTLNASGGTITMDGSIAVGQVYAVAQTINVNGSLNTTTGSNGSIYLAGAIINILGNINSNGNSSNNSSLSNLTSANMITANNRRNGVNGSNSQSNSTSALSADDTTYTSNGGAINIIASGDIHIGSSSIISTTNNSSYISANGHSGGAINIISVNGNINNQGIVDALGKTSTGGTVIIAAKNTNTFTGGLISSDGYTQAGVIQIGVANGIGSGSTLAPPSINSQVATLLAAVNFTPSSSSSILTSNTSLDNATVITANSAASTSQVTLNSQAGQIYIAGNNSLNTAATIQANADTGGLIILSSPAGNYQNTGYIQTNGGAGLGGTIAQSGLISTTLIGATVEANGTLGGGNIIIGRDFQASPLSGSATQAALLPSLSSVITLPTSASTTIDANSSLSANSTLSGDGGNVLVWGDGNLVAGALSAKALGASGNGGFIETSGDTLSIATGASVSAASANGTSGTWLLDPYDVTIAATGATGTTYSATFTAGATSTILASAINASLNGGTSVSISTGSSSSNTIYVNSAISATSGTATLTLTGGTINLAANITTVGSQTYTGAVVINNAAGITLTSTNSNITFSSTVDSTAGSYYGLSVTNGTGTTAFGGIVGANSGTSALGYLCVNSAGCSASAVGTTTGTGTTTLAGNVTTSGNQTYGGNLTLGANTALTSTANSSNGVVTIAGNLNSLAATVSGIIQFLGGSSGQWKLSLDNGATWATYSAASPCSGANCPTITYSTSNAISDGVGGTCSAVGGCYSWTAGTGTYSVLVVGGGGAGGTNLVAYDNRSVGGGGGGGVISTSVTAASSTIYKIVAGSGAYGISNPIDGNDNSFISSYSSFDTQKAAGGGSAWTKSNAITTYQNGGSGAGGYLAYPEGSIHTAAYVGTANGIGLGNNGSLLGGGGGAGGAPSGANGGAGYASSITGTTVYYGAGGGGSAGDSGATRGNGGSNSGGIGGTYGGASGGNGVAYTGSGGGGSNGSTNAGGNGGAGTVVVSGSIIQSQGTYTLTINSGTGKSSIGGTVSNVTTLTINSKSPLSAVSGAIGGSTAVAYNTASGYTGSNGAAGVLSLAGTNTYTGGTTITGGTLQAGSTTAFGGAASAITVNSGAALDLNGKTLTYANALTLNGTGISSGGALTNSSATAGTYIGLITLGSDSSINASSGNIVISNTGTITGATYGLTLNGANTASSIASIIGTTSGALTKSGTGTWTLSGVNTYTGGTTISAGTLSVGSNTYLGNTSGAINLNGGTLNISTGTAFSSARTINVLASSTINNADTSGVTFTGSVTGPTVTGTPVTLTLTGANATTFSTGAITNGTGTSTVALVQNTTGTTTLSGSNNFTGGTTISAGTLKAASAAALGTGAVSIGSSGTLDLAYTGTVALGSTLSMSTGAAITNSANTSSLSVAGTSTLNGNINTAGNQTYTGAVTLGANTTLTTLNTSSVNTNGTITFGSTVDSTAGSYYALTTTNGTGLTSFAGAVGATNNLGVLTLNGTGAITLGGSVTTAGNQSYAGAVSAAAGITITANGTLSATTTLVTNGNNNNSYYALGVTDLTPPSQYYYVQSGSYSATLSSANNYNVGILFYNNTGTLNGASSSSSWCCYNYPVLVNGVQSSVLNSISVVTRGDGIASRVPTAVSVYGSNTAFTSANTLTQIPSSALYNSNLSVLGSGYQQSNFNLIGSGSLSFSGGGTSSPTVSNTITLSNATAYQYYLVAFTSTGGTLNSAQTGSSSSYGLGLALNAINLYGNAYNTSSVTFSRAVTASGALSVNTGTFSATSISTSGALTINNSGVASITGAITNGSSAASIVQNGAGTTTLSGNNSFTGGTTITAGTISAGSSNALGTGAVSIGSSGTLDLAYTGTVALGSTLSMSTGSAITNSANTSSLSVAGASTLNGSINTAGNQTYTGAVTLGANATLTTLNTSSVNTNGTITFGSTVDSTAGSYYGLTVTNGTGTTAFGGIVGANSGTSALGYLCINSAGCSASAVGTTTGTGTTTLAGNVTTSGNQTYGGNLTLGANTALNSTANSGNGAVTIAGAVNTASSSNNGIIQFLGSGNWKYSVDGGTTWAYYSNSGSGNTYVAGSSTTTSAPSSLPFTISYSGSSYSFTPTTTITSNVLVVAGGGAGGSSSAAYTTGGGGGGGVVYVPSASLSGAYTISVGSGANSYYTTSGGNSSLSLTSSPSTFVVTANGGGGGGGASQSSGLSGGSGGGGHYGSGPSSDGGAATQGSVTGFTGYTLYGNSGGASNFHQTGGGGGGGASQAGFSGSGTNSATGVGGNGGQGVSLSISGSSVVYGSGGGASGQLSGGAGGTNGGNSLVYGGAVNGVANTGGGGGAGTNSGAGQGGSGVVILSSANLGSSVNASYTLTINSGTGASTIGGSVSNVTTLTINSKASNSAVSGAIGGSTAVAYNTASGYTGSNGAAGVLSLAGTNTYAGGTTVTGGTLQAGSVAAFGGATGAITVNTGAALDLNGKTLTYANALTLNGSGISNGGALTNSSATGGTYIGAITLGSDSLIGSTAGAITVSGAIASSGSAYNLALVGSKAITLSSATNTLSTIASGSGLGALSITNNQALTIGSMTIGGTTYSGLSSTGTILVQTITGNLTVNNAVTTNSTSAVTSAPAIKLSAGFNDATTSTTNNIILGSSSSSLITAGSGAIIALYSGAPTSSTNLSVFVAGQSASNTSYGVTTTTGSLASGAGYYALYRSTQPNLYVIYGSSDTPTYGTAPTISYSFNTLANGNGTTYVSSDTAIVNASGTALFKGTNSTTGATNVSLNSSANAGSYTTVTYLSGLSSPIYALSAGSNTGSLTINKANAYVIVTSGQSSTYGATPTINYTFNTNSAGTGSAISASLTGLSGTATITNAPTSSSNAGTYSLTYASGLSSTNYAFNAAASSVSYAVNQAQAYVIVTSGQSSTYGATPTINYTFNTNSAGTGSAISASPTGLSGTATITNAPTSSSNAGTYSLTYASGLSSTNYAFNAAASSRSYTVNAAPLNITISKTYDGNYNFTNANSYTLSGSTYNSDAMPTIASGTAATSSANAASYTGFASNGMTLSNTNYTLTGGTVAATISPKTITYTTAGATSVYGSLAILSTPAFVGLVGSDNPSASVSLYSGTTPVSLSATTNAGTYAQQVAITNGNYQLGSIGNTIGSLVISPATLMIAGANGTPTYNGSTQTNTGATVSLNGGAASTISGTTVSTGIGAQTFTLSGLASGLNASSTAIADNLSITPNAASGAIAGNYSISYANGSLTIGKANLSVTGTQAYNGTATIVGSSLTISGIAGQTFTGSGTADLTTKNIQSNQQLASVNGLVLAPNGSFLVSNYNTINVANTSVSITPLAITLTAPSITKVYDGGYTYNMTSANLSTMSSQLVGGDSVSAASVVFTGNNPNVGTNKSVSLNSATISDGNSGNNYIVTLANSSTSQVTPASLTITANNASKFVTQSDTAGFNGVVYSGFVNGETASSALSGTLTVTRSNASTNGAGSYTGVLTPGGQTASNYTITPVAGNYTIVAANQLLVQVTPVTTTYGTAPTYTATAQYLSCSVSGCPSSGSVNTIHTLSPVITGNAFSVSDGAGGTAGFTISPTGATSSGSGNTNVGSYQLSNGTMTGSSTNFSNNLVLTGSLTVAPLTLSANQLGVSGISKVYNGSTAISGLSLNTTAASSSIKTGDAVVIAGTGTYADANVGTSKSVTVSVGLTGNDAGNYVLSSNQLTANIGTITQLATVTYTGTSGGNWSNASNWAGGAIPTLGNVAMVVIPTATTVVYDAANLSALTPTSAITDNGTLSFTSGLPTTFANNVSGTGAIAQSGAGALTLTGGNSYSGGTTLAAGSSLIAGTSSALGTGALNSSGGTFSTSGVTLPNLTVNGAVVLASNITSSGNQAYNGAVTINNSTNSTTLKSFAGNITFASTLNAGTTNQSLELSATAGQVTFNGQVGVATQTYNTGTQSYSPTTYASYQSQSSNNLSNLTVSANTINLNADISTRLTQIYNGSLLVGDNGSNGPTRVLLSEDPAITFNGTINDTVAGTHNLFVKAVTIANEAPSIIFNDVVGGIAALKSLTASTGAQDAATGALYSAIDTTPANLVGTVTIKENVSTTGDQTYTAKGFTLGNGTANQTLSLTTQTGNIAFNAGSSSGSGFTPAGSGLIVSVFNGGGTVSGLSGSGLNYSVTDTTASASSSSTTSTSNLTSAPYSDGGALQNSFNNEFTQLASEIMYDQSGGSVTVGSPSEACVLRYEASYLSCVQ